MDLHLKGKIALVTGSTTGIGFSIAESLAKEEVTVAINGRSEERVTQAIEKISCNYKQAELIPIVADLSTNEGITKVIQNLPAIDILINNYGIYEVQSFYELSEEDWLKSFNHNVMSGVRLSRHYLPSMLKQNWGRIIFISSESALQIPTDMIHYGVSKTAQVSLARGLAELTTATDITVNSVLPGPTRTEGVENFLEQTAKQNNQTLEELEKNFFTDVRPTSLIKRFIKPEEVSSLVTYLCSPLAAAINGSAVRIDGGLIRSII
ncbi:SDR family NAD(P)-dependent oxidoreductase [Legionella sp. D16C41]|uniref:SDR family NAD(P)-dependent oxidoreductase n=1 Tax=Legionella sp. D16C41 TaxID=3402688 RepID=UPI003AF8C37C